MAVSVDYDLRGGEFRWSSSTSAQWRRRYQANGIAAGTVAEQYNEIMGALPALGASAPSPWNLLCIDRTIDELWQAPDATYKAQGFVIYQFPTQTANKVPTAGEDNGISLSVSSFTESVETTKNFDGTRITVTDSDGLVRGETVTVPMSRARIGLTRPEANYPRARINTYTNKLNSGLWNGYPIRTVRCESITAESLNNGVDWNVDYRFIYREEGWNEIEIVGRDLLTGKPIAAPTGAQLAIVRPYTSVDFSPLNINLP